MKIKKLILPLFLFLTVLLLLFSVKGERGNPINYQSSELRDTNVGSPFESSGSTSRYALTESIVEDGDIFLSEEQAHFASPDVSKANGRYFSIFTPGVSFLGVPFYWVGKQFGLPQLFTYLSTFVFAILSVFLITKIARKVGAGLYSSLIAGVVFLFATNALAYSQVYTQHILSTFLILLATLLALGDRTLWRNMFFGLVYGLGLLVDIPNGLMMLPLVAYILYRQFEIDRSKKKFTLKLKLSFVGLLIGLIPMLTLFGWYNHKLTGSAFRIAQSVGRAEEFITETQVEEKEEDVIKISEYKKHYPLDSRRLFNGLNVLLVSDQRGIVFYSPVLLVGLLGFYFLNKMKENRLKVGLLFAIVLVNLIVYASFSDPTGSWAFGPRYLIPAASIMAVLTASAIDRFIKDPRFIFIFTILMVYSIAVNVLGVMTTTNVPPKVEAINMTEPIPYTYEYNLQLMFDKGLNSTLFYSLYLSDKLNSEEYTMLFIYAIFVLTAVLYSASYIEERSSENYENT